jgi:hypothetical protein
MSVSSSSITFTAADNVRYCGLLLDEGASLRDAWRFGIMQTLGDYQSSLMAHGSVAAAAVFTDVPALLAAPQLNAAIAGLAEWLAHRDSWAPPSWCFAPERYLTEPWYVAGYDVDALKRVAEAESPAEFRDRGVYTSLGGLSVV